MKNIEILNDIEIIYIVQAKSIDIKLFYLYLYFFFWEFASGIIDLGGWNHK